MEPENGAKLVEPDGSMLNVAWETAAGEFVNALNGEEALAALGELLPVDDGKATVLVAHDTRSTSPALAALLKQGAWDVGAEVIDKGAATTPQLHFCVRAFSRDDSHSLDPYYTVTRAEFITLCGGRKPALGGPLVVDCANGVGAIAMLVLRDLVIDTVVVNDEARSGSPLNDGCGADFVQKTRRMPILHGASKARAAAVGAGSLWASLDGDADRLVMYSATETDTVALADGDRFATLAAREVSHAIRIAGIEGATVGVAQTAYSNGAATDFLRTLPGVEIVDSCTGVKHLECAVHGFDVGIYWEPNGHGTVLYTDAFRTRIANSVKSSNGVQDGSERANDALAFLDCVGKLANQAVGDGIADLLLVVGILIRRGMSFDDWLEIYKERCVSNAKVRVKNKAVVQTEDFDRKVVSPASLRERIDAVQEGDVRAFVRPSGTEDVVRVFAEANTQAAADKAAEEIARAVYDTCAGVGERV